MALSLVAEEILTEHRAALLKSFKIAAQSGIKGTDTSPENYERRLRDRMIDELGSHAERAGRNHKHFWERLQQHADPETLAEMIEQERKIADAKEKNGKAEQLEEQHGIKNMDGRLEAVEDHLVGNGDGRFSEQATGGAGARGSVGDEEQPDPAQTSAGIAKLLAAYRGRPMGVEAQRPRNDPTAENGDKTSASFGGAQRPRNAQTAADYAMTTPDPSTPGGARVVTWDESGPKTHSSHPDPHTALAQMVAAGYTDPAPGSYAEHSQSPDWDWLHKWAQHASSGDDTALSQFHSERPHPAARAARQSGDLPKNHSEQLDRAVLDTTAR